MILGVPAGTFFLILLLSFAFFCLAGAVISAVFFRKKIDEKKSQQRSVHRIERNDHASAWHRIARDEQLYNNR